MVNELHIYLRVSSDIQKTDGFGLENQKELGLKVSKIKGMKPIIHNEGSKSSNLLYLFKSFDILFKPGI